jgi:hypothetical protein
MKVAELQNKLTNLEPTAELLRYDYLTRSYHRVKKVTAFEKRQYIIDPSRCGVFIEKEEYVEKYGREPDPSEIVEGYTI